jgi:hypothetical protein
MNTFELTAKAQTRLVYSLQKFGNVLSLPHKKALYTLVESFFRMATGALTERWAFPIATGCGKTRAIIECCATLHHANNTTLSVVVCASRIEALCTMKRDMLACGIPESKIGLIYTAGKLAKYSEPTTEENSGRQFLLISHQRIANKKHLQQYNSYLGEPRSLIIYDESLLVSDIEHFPVDKLCKALGGWIAQFQLEVLEKPERVTILNWLTERLASITASFTNYDDSTLNYLTDPCFHLSEQEQEDYREELTSGGDQLLADFVAVAHLKLRLLRGNKTAAITYQIAIPTELKNILVLDASYPIRQLEKVDPTLHNAEDLPSCKAYGVKFAELKRFDHVTLYRMAQHGGRSSIATDKKKMRKILLDTVKVIQDIPKTEHVLVFVYKDRLSTNPKKYLETCLKNGNVDLTRIHIETWGNETSLNSYRYCQHVILVGILHRDSTELHAQHLGQVNDLSRRVTTEEIKAISLSERTHLGYQALSRGCCRVMGSEGQALAMTGYIVEYEEELEAELSKVMRGVTWKTWKPVYSDNVAHGQMVSSLQHRLIQALEPLTVERISCKSFKSTVLKDAKVDKNSWLRALKGALEQNAQWKQEDQWIVKV